MNPYTPALNWQSRAILGRHVRVHLRNWYTATLPPVCVPLIMLLAFGVGLGAQMGALKWRGQSLDYLHYLAPGIVWNLGNSAIKISPAFGLTSGSDRMLLKIGYTYEISGFGQKLSRMFGGH